MKKILFSMMLSFVALFCVSAKELGNFYPGNHSYIQYTGRVDFSNTTKPKFWSSGVYLAIKFKGTFCTLQINDELLWGSIHNYLEIKVDDQPAYRIQLKGKENTINLAQNLSKGVHTIIICKNTEFENGYVEIVGITCHQLLKPKEKPKRKLEFIGDSITCGAASDESVVKCEQGQWHDQHNAYGAYGPTTARNLKAQYHLSSVSGIGLMHSCCDKKIVMPQVYDKVNMAKDTIKWDFNAYQPDVVTVCLGQNDGIQDSAQFTSAYIKFAKTLRAYYPKAKLVFLSSPMANKELKATLVKYINAVVIKLKSTGEDHIGSYFFVKQYNAGCGSHPSVKEHELIGAELTAYLKKTMNW